MADDTYNQLLWQSLLNDRPESQLNPQANLYEPQVPLAGGVARQRLTEDAWQTLGALRQGLSPRSAGVDVLAPTPPERAAMSGEIRPAAWYADPIEVGSQVMAPRLLPYARGVGEMFAGRELGAGGRLSLLKGEAGNLGPVPVHPETAEPLPHSVVRGARGNLTRVVHGTDVTFPDFDPNFYGRGAGGDLYGPGIYTSQAPSVTQGYSFRNWPAEANDMLREIKHLHYNADWYGDAANLGEAGVSSAEAREAAQAYRSQAEQVQARLSRHMDQNPWLYQGAPQSRPVYLDIRQPFDIDAPVDPAAARKLFDAAGTPLSSTNSGFRELVEGGGASGHDVYRRLEQELGNDRGAVNKLLRDAGYDGITHWGGQGSNQHKVWIAFDPASVYPAANVEALPGFKR